MKDFFLQNILFIFFHARSKTEVSYNKYFGCANIMPVKIRYPGLNLARPGSAAETHQACPLKPYKFSQYCRKTPAVCLVNLITEQFVL